MYGLRNRVIVGELMDSPTLPPREHAQALAGLRRINCISRTSWVLWREITSFGFPSAGRPISLLDLASGGGDVPIALASHARRQNLPLHVSGCDISRTALDYATERAAASQIQANFFRLDVTQEPIPQGYDVVTCCLFLHHLSDVQIEEILANIVRAAPRLVLITDLVRDSVGLVLAFVGTRFLSRSRIVHVDGIRSLRASLQILELAKLARQAGMAGVQIRRHWPRRMLLKWNRS